MKRQIWQPMLAALFAFLLVACAPAATDTPTGEPSTGAGTAAEDGTVTLRIGWAGSPDSLNPGVAVLSEAYSIFELVYDSMYRLELDGSFSLELAESVDVSDDGTVWTYTLREGATWHDGEPVTAADVAFSYNLYMNTVDFPFLPVYTAYFSSIEAPDERTVVVTLSEAIPNMEAQLVYLYVLPEHIWGGLEGQAAVDFENTEMIGSGPFKLVEYSQNQFVSLEAVKDHYLNAPKVDQIVFQTFSNQDALVQALRTAQVDMITEMPATAVPALRNTENVEVVTGPPSDPGTNDIFFNQVLPENCPPEDGVCSGHPALLDRNVRLAIAHATDKQQIIDVTLLGFGTPGRVLIPDGLGIWFNSELEDYAFDTALANQILDEAGYADTDGDGVREMPDGTNPLVFRLNWPSDSVWAQRAAELVSDTWAQIGIATEPQALDPDALTAICCPAFDYDIILWGWVSDPDPGYLLSVTTTDEIPTGNSETGYSNPEYDALYVQQATTLDREERRQIIWEMQRILFEDVVYVVPFYDQAVQAYRTDRFTGWQLDGKISLSNIASLLVVEPVQ